MNPYRWKLILGTVVLLIGLYSFLPNVLPKSSWLPQQKLNFGLDIQGGLHLVMGVDRSEVLLQTAQKELRSLLLRLKEEGVEVADSQVLDQGREFRLNFKESKSREKAETYISEYFNTMVVLLESQDQQLSYRFLDFFVQEALQKTLSQAIETVRNRIDEFGVAEPVIAPQGDDRILVQLPGVQDPEAAKTLVSSAARLDFMLVEERSPEELQNWVKEAEEKGIKLGELKYSDYVRKINEALKDKLPPNTMILFEKMENVPSLELGRIPYLLRTDTGLDGSLLDFAQVGYDQFGKPQVQLRFSAAGATRFREITGKNLRRQLAIVLDKVVKSAPRIEAEIGTGEAVITLGGARDRTKMLEEAKMIATTLRAGSLPVSLDILEERRVGPTLGMDHLRKAELGALVGAILVILIMVVRYKVLGVISVVALFLNVLLLLSALTSFQATLTLPGVAGIALTVGVAVDANVLIFERIREEMERGASFRLALAEGFQKALSAILDSNTVVAATSGILLLFGTGPIRGFAVTLLTGIVTTLFCQVFLAGAFLQWLVEDRRITSLKV